MTLTISSFLKKTDEPEAETGVDETEQEETEPEVRLISAEWKPGIKGFQYNETCFLDVKGEYLKETIRARIRGKLFGVYNGEEIDLAHEVEGFLNKDTGIARMKIKSLWFINNEHYTAWREDKKTASEYKIKKIIHSRGANARFNNIADQSVIEAGEILKVPNFLIEYKKKEKQQNRTNKKTGAEDTVTIVDTQCYKAVSKTIFRYADHKEKWTANRRFIYCWKKDEIEGWQNVGIVMTDDWGQPWYIQDYIAEQKENIKVKVPDSTFENGYSEEEVPRGFYLANQSEEMEFDISGKKLYPANFCPGETWVFMYAPLYTIQGKDQNYWNDDEFGFENPAELKTNEQTDIYQLIERGLAQEVVIPKPEKIKDPWTGDADTAITIDLKRNVLEYVSLIKKYTYQLDAAIKVELEVKKPYSNVNGLLNRSNWVLELMKLAGDKTYSSIDEKNICDYQDNISKYVEFIENRYLRSDKVYSVNTLYTQHDKNGEEKAVKQIFNPAIMAKLAFMKPTDVAKKLISIIQNPEFIRVSEEYWKTIAAANYEDPQSTFFSFKHPTITFLQALQDACFAISMVSDEKLVESFYLETIRPLEEHMICRYDCFDDNDELKTETLNLIEQFEDMLGKDKVKTIQDELQKADAGAALFPYSKTSIHQKIWNIVTNSRTTGFWNNQAGADSMMTRFLKAYARYRNKQIIKNEPAVLRISIRQLKMYMVSVRYVTLPIHGGTLTMARVKEQYVAITKIRTSVEKNVNPNWLLDADRFAEANRYINSLSCGFQLVAAVAGIASFLEKEERTFADHVSLADSVANVGLALSGLSDKQWAQIFFSSKNSVQQANILKAATGQYLTGVGFICTCINSSMAAADHWKYGDEFMTCLSVFKAVLGGAGALGWIFAAAAMSGPVGWIVFGGILLIDTVCWLNKRVVGEHSCIYALNLPFRLCFGVPDEDF